MKLSTRADIDAPIEAVWAAVADADAFERFAARNGGVARRTDDGVLALGSGWVTRFAYRGAAQVVETIVSGFDAPHRLDVDSHAGGLDAFLRVDLDITPAGLTRMRVSIDLRPTSLAGRVMIQTLKLAKKRLNARFRAWVRRFACGIAAAGG